MNVRGVGFDRLGKNGVNEADNGSVVLLLQQILRFRNRIGQRGQIHIVTNPLHHLHGFRRIVLIGGIQGLIEAVRLNGRELRPPTAHAVCLGQCGVGSPRAH